MPNYNVWKLETVGTTKQLQSKNDAYKSGSNIWHMYGLLFGQIRNYHNEK
jgi:hypothetical protein